MKQDVAQPRKKKEIQLFVARSGPLKGKPYCEAAFATKPEAVEFLTSQHGLEPEESKKLARSMRMSLKPKWHGAELCEIETETFSPAKAARALSGDLYLPKVNENSLPKPRAISMKAVLTIKLKVRKKPVRRKKTISKLKRTG